MVKVSVIVPVYNVEEYIVKCLDSLVRQTLKDIEILVINDGSPDNSQDIIDKYVKKYKNVKSYVKKNGGLSDARNYGLKYAKGEYISFVDSDDYIDDMMMERMYSKAISNDFDMVVCNLDLVDEAGNFIRHVYSNVDSDLFNVSVKKSMLSIYPTAVNKLFKKNLFDNDVWYEDVEFIHRMFPYINSIGVVNDFLYYYVQREGSITRTFDKRLYNYIDNWNGIIDFYKKRKIYDDYKKELEYCYVRYLYATFVKQAVNYGDVKEYNKAVFAAIENVKKNFSKYRRNSYFYKSIKGLYLVFFGKFIAKVVYFIYSKRK